MRFSMGVALLKPQHFFVIVTVISLASILSSKCAHVAWAANACKIESTVWHADEQWKVAVQLVGYARYSKGCRLQFYRFPKDSQKRRLGCSSQLGSGSLQSILVIMLLEERNLMILLLQHMFPLFSYINSPEKRKKMIYKGSRKQKGEELRLLKEREWLLRREKKKEKKLKKERN